MSFYHSFSKILCIKSCHCKFAISSALIPSGFKTLQHLVLHHCLSCFMLLFFLHVFSFVCFGRLWLPFSPPLCVFLLHIRHRLSRPYCGSLFMCCPHCLHSHIASQMLAARGKSQRCWTISLLFMKKHHSNFLWIRVQFSEANGRNKSSGHPETKQHLLCPYHDVNSMVQNASVFFSILQGHFNACCTHWFNM